MNSYNLISCQYDVSNMLGHKMGVCKREAPQRKVKIFVRISVLYKEFQWLILRNVFLPGLTENIEGQRCGKLLHNKAKYSLN